MDSTQPPVNGAHQTAGSRIVAIHTFALLAVAVAFRCWRIDHVPGVNGDEAWMGVQALRFLDGQPVRWFTPTGNPMNLFHFAPMVLLHSVWLPSVGLLRTTVLISGLLALPVNYFLCRRVFGLRIASLSTIILAVMPINIAYSRFAWDASQSLLFTLPPIYCSLLAISEPDRRIRWLVLASLSLGAALVVHPTNVFIAPIVALAGLIVFWNPLTTAVMAAKTSWRYRIAWTACGLTIVAIAIFGASLLEVAGRRLVSIEQITLFAHYYLDLFSGTTAVRFLAGSQADGSATDVVLYRLAAGSFLGFAGYGLVRLLRGPVATTTRLLAAGSAASGVAFFLVAGPSALAPGNERYAICLVAPGAILLAIGTNWWIDRHRVIAGMSGAAVAWLLLVGVYVHYFRAIEETGGQAHPTFRTAAIEPKRATCELLQHLGSPSQPLTVVATEWWNYWPIAYLAYRFEDVQVVGSDTGDPVLGPSDPRAESIPVLGHFRSGVATGPVCFVEFHGSKAAQVVQQCLTNADVMFSTATIRDASRRPVLTIMQPVQHPLAPTPVPSEGVGKSR